MRPGKKWEWVYHGNLKLPPTFKTKHYMETVEASNGGENAGNGSWGTLLFFSLYKLQWNSMYLLKMSTSCLTIWRSFELLSILHGTIYPQKLAFRSQTSSNYHMSNFHTLSTGQSSFLPNLAPNTWLKSLNWFYLKL